MHKILEVKKERRKLTTLSMTSYSVIKAGKGKVSYEIKHFLEIVPSGRFGIRFTFCSCFCHFWHFRADRIWCLGNIWL